MTALGISGPRRRIWNGVAWKAFDGTTITPGIVTDRSGLVLGTDKPDGTTVGPINFGGPGQPAFTDVFPVSGNSITISASGTYTGIRYWGTVLVTQPGVIFRECWFCGPDPDTFSDILGCIQNYGAIEQKFEIWDSKIDPMPWVTVRGKTKLNPYYMGLHGGNINLQRCEVTNVYDGWNWLGPSSTGGAVGQETRCEMSWFHHGLYNNNVYPPSDGQPHANAFQSNYGQNLFIRGNMMGGDRDPVGYNIWPNGYNGADDYWNTCLALKQEVSNDALHAIDNVMIELNWFQGGRISVQQVYDAALPNVWATTTIRNNLFGDRFTDWGRTMSGTGPGTAGTTTFTGNGFDIVKGTLITSSYSGNVKESNGTAVTITDGG